MKKSLNKLAGRFKRGKSTEAPNVPRITNDTLAEHREAIIAKGKRYKYPMQQTKHRVVVISSIIVVLLVIATGFFTWWRLYKVQDISQFFYRVTQILPVSVASIDGEQVLYKDYLLELRSAVHYLTAKEAVNLASDDGKRQLDYQKRQAMNKALENAYVRKLARESNVQVTTVEVDEFIDNQIKSNTLGASKEDFTTVIRDYYDWSFDEYKESIRAQLLKRKVVAAIDAKAKQRADTMLQQLQQGADFATLARDSSDDEAAKQTGGDTGFVGVTQQDPEGLIAAANKLEPNQLSSIVVGSNGLYLIKTLEKRENQVRFARIFIRFTEFDQRLKQLREQGKVQEYIEIPELAVGLARSR